MKNLAIVALLFSAFVLTMSSCKKVEAPTSVDIIANAGTATISGIVYADKDDSNAADEFASGAILLIEVDPNDFPAVSTSNYNNNMLFYSATVGNDGTWTATIPAPKTPISITVHPQDFRSNYIDASGDTESAEFYYDNASFNMTVVEGATPIRDFWYDRN
jgi:hypothetical protein